jgi:hypothetical protein
MVKAAVVELHVQERLTLQKLATQMGRLTSRSATKGALIIFEACRVSRFAHPIPDAALSPTQTLLVAGAERRLASRGSGKPALQPLQLSLVTKRLGLAST